MREIIYCFNRFFNRLRSAYKVLAVTDTIILFVDRDEIPLDVILLYPDEIAYYGDGPDKTPMKAHQVIAYMDFYNAWIDSYSKSFSGKEEVGK